MNEKNKRYQHFLWICNKICQKPKDFADMVRMLEQTQRPIMLKKYRIELSLAKNTVDGRLYVLDLYEDGKIIRRSPCYVEAPRRTGRKYGKSIRMVSEILGVMILVGITIVGVGVAYLFGSDMVNNLTNNASCKILRLNIFDIGQSAAYYVIEVQNTGTQIQEFDVKIKTGTGKDDLLKPTASLDKFESHTWSGSIKFTDNVSPNTEYLIEVRSTDDTAICTAKTTTTPH